MRRADAVDIDRIRRELKAVILKLSYCLVVDYRYHTVREDNHEVYVSVLSLATFDLAFRIESWAERTHARLPIPELQPEVWIDVELMPHEE